MRIVRTHATDGLELQGLYTEANSPKGIIIHVHGMAGSITQQSYYQPMHEQYSKAGWSFVAVEHRGTSSIKEFWSETEQKVLNIGNAYEIFEECVHDIAGWVQWAKQEGYVTIWLQSHSLGTSKTAYYLATVKDHGVAGTIWLSPSDMVGLMHDPIGQKDYDLLLPEAKQLVADNKPRQLLSNCLWGDVILSAQSCLSLFGDGAKDAIFNYGDETLGWSVVNTVNVPVLAFTGTKDDGIQPVIDPHQAMHKLETELKHAPRQKTIVFEAAEHEFAGFEEQIIEEVLPFISIT